MNGFSWLHGPCICVPGEPCKRLTCQACGGKQMASVCPAVEAPLPPPLPRYAS